MAKKKESGLRSGAGLVQYYSEEERSAFKMDPKIVIIAAVVFAVIVELFRYYF